MRLALLALPLLLAGCGDSLEDRNAALNHDQLRGEREITFQTRPSAPEAAVDSAPADAYAPTSDDDETLYADASDEDLMAGTRGFSADPMDDAGGLAPEPLAPERYVPESVQPESFGD